MLHREGSCRRHMKPVCLQDVLQLWKSIVKGPVSIDGHRHSRLTAPFQGRQPLQSCGRYPAAKYRYSGKQDLIGSHCFR